MPKKTEFPSVPEPSPNWIGSRPEWFIYWALMKLGYKDRFTYQSSQMGGRGTLGGAVIDFLIPELSLGINVQSAYYHYSTTAKRMAGEMQRAQIESRGIRLIFIDEEDALRAPEFYVSEALRGRDHSVMGRR